MMTMTITQIATLCHGSRSVRRFRHSDSCRRLSQNTCPKGTPATAGQLRTGTDVFVKKSTQPIPDADLSEEIWGIDHIAAFLRMRASAAYCRVREPGFPAPCSGDQRHRRWHSGAVREHFARVSTKSIRARSSSSVKAPAIAFRARKVTK